ncbi:MAG: Arc family DNA-binding protein [Saprospiraceae bacterium]
MSQKKSFVLRIDEATYEALEKWAADEFRSVNGQLEYIIHQALKKEGRTPQRKAIDKAKKANKTPKQPED